MHPPTIKDIEALAETALRTIPEVLRSQLRDVVIQVVDFPDEATEKAMRLQTPFDLLGLYHGIALTEQSVADPKPQPDLIYLYRRPLLDYWCESGEALADIVRHVLIHEIGHHFGFSDEDMAAIESQT